MIIDLILDRKDDLKNGHDYYNAHDFYFDCMAYGRVGDEITHAMDELEEDDVKKALCNYIIKNEYNPDICNFVNSVDWL